MGRPPLPIGTYGKITVYRLGDRSYRARTRYRDYDGVTRPVERVGASVTGATNNLRAALRDRGRETADGEITPDTRVGAVAELWLRDLDESDRALRTKITYRESWERHLRPAVAELRVRDMRVSRVDRVIRELRERSGTGTATHAKVVLSGLLGLAVRHDALESNPVRELTSGNGRRRKKEKVTITEDSLERLRKYLRDSPGAAKFDLVDLVDVLSGLGCRIGELLALDWTRVDDVAGTLAIEGTVIRVPGSGLIVQPHTKSKAGMRTIVPPAWVMKILVRRYETAHGPWVFPSTRGTLRDDSNTRGRLRQVIKGTEWEPASARLPRSRCDPARRRRPVCAGDRGLPRP